MKSRSVESGAYILVVRPAHNEHLVLRFDGLEAFGLRSSRVFRQSRKEYSAKLDFRFTAF
jgi:hypothetical protein